MQAQVISFNCVVKNKAGKVISSTYNREALTVGDPDFHGILSGLNKKMQNLQKGEKRVISVVAEEAYGLYDPKKVILFPRKKLPTNIHRGQSLTIVSKTGVHRHYQILDILPDLVSLDENHPLAGQDLVFEIETLAVREATPQEIDESINPVSGQVWH